MNGFPVLPMGKLLSYNKKGESVGIVLLFVIILFIRKFGGENAQEKVSE